MRDDGETRAEVVRARHDDVAVSVLGRLLWVGVVAGLVIGGLAGTVLPAGGDISFAVGGFAIGAMAGLVAGVIVQALNAVALQSARTLRPSLAPTAMRILLVPLPAVAAGAVLWSLSTAGPGWIAFAAPTWAAVLTAGALGGCASWIAGPWCLAPVASRGTSHSTSTTGR